MAAPERKYLKELTTTIDQFLRNFDKIMLTESTMKRGEALALETNKLNLANDSAKRFGLNLDFNGKPMKPTTRKETHGRD